MCFLQFKKKDLILQVFEVKCLVIYVGYLKLLRFYWFYFCGLISSIKIALDKRRFLQNNVFSKADLSLLYIKPHKRK